MVSVFDLRYPHPYELEVALRFDADAVAVDGWFPDAHRKGWQHQRQVMNSQEQAWHAIEAMVHRETQAWDRQDAVALVDLFHPDMVWPWPPTDHDHDPATWVFVMGRFDRERWTRGWQHLFATHDLVHNRREIRSIVVTAEADGGYAVVDVDTLWRDRQGRDNHWRGRACKGYTRMPDGQWKLILHTGLLAY